MARVQTIIVGGGIGAGSPFALNFVPIVGSVDPPLLITTDFMFTVPTGATRGLILNRAGTDPAAGPEPLRVKGGAILESLSFADGVCIGDGTDAGATGQILIGDGITPNAQANVTVIGQGATGPSGGTGTVIGASSSLQGASGLAINGTCTVGGAAAGVTIQGTSAGGAGSMVNIGGVLSTTTGVVCVGMSATVAAAATNSVSVGNSNTVSATGAVCIGAGASVAAGFTNSIAIGNGAQGIAAQTFSVGSNVGGAPITQMVIGHGLNTLANPTAVTIRLTNGSGSNNTAGALTLQAGLSTGNIVGPGVNLDAGIPGASGVTLQTARTWVSARPTTTAADTGLMVWDVDNATLERVTVGAADSGGAGFKLLRIPN